MHNHHHHGGSVHNSHRDDQEDKTSLEAAAEAAAKVNAMLIAKGMLKPNQLHAGTNVITKKAGGPNSLVVAEVEINNLNAQCRNTLTRGTTQEEISRASGAAVTTKGRYMAPDEKARNIRDRCLYLNVQASTKESADIAVQKIHEIIRDKCGQKADIKGQTGLGGRGAKSKASFKPSGTNRGQLSQPPPPLMSLPTPPPPIQTHLPPPHMPPPPQTVTVMQEKLYIGLEHAPPNFDTKNKILGPAGSYLQHIQSETGSAVSLRGKSSGFGDINGPEAFEPMHVHLEHPSLACLQEAKKLAENLIQTVQQSYVSFQQALAAMPASIPTGLITGVPQQSFMEQQLPPSQELMALQRVPEQTLQSVQSQEFPIQTLGPPTILMPAGSVANHNQVPVAQALGSASAPQMMIPQSISLNMPLVNNIPVSATSIIAHQPGQLEVAGQQQVLLSQQAPSGHPPPPQALTAPPPQIVQTMGPLAYTQPTVQVVSQTPVSLAPPNLLHQPNVSLAPTILQQAPLNVSGAPPPSLLQQTNVSMAHPPPNLLQQPTAASMAPPTFPPQANVSVAPLPSVLQSQSVSMLPQANAPPPGSILQQPSASMAPPPTILQPNVSVAPPPTFLQSPSASMPHGTLLQQSNVSVTAPPMMQQQHHPVPPPSAPPPALATWGQPTLHPVQSALMTSQYMTTMAAPASLVYTVASSTAGLSCSSPKGDIVKRRFTEEKDKIPDNVLGYQHGPPHLVNLLRSSPPPTAQSAPTISHSLVPPPGPQLIQAGPPPTGILLTDDQGHQLTSLAVPPPQTFLQPGSQAHQALFGPPIQGQTIMMPDQTGHPQISPGMPMGVHPPLHIGLAEGAEQAAQRIFGSPGIDKGPSGLVPSSGATLMPPPPPPSPLASQATDLKIEDARAMPPPKSPDIPWDTSHKRRSPHPQEEPEKKKIRGILKNKSVSEKHQEIDSKDVDSPGLEVTEDTPDGHPASPQYQGQPLRYPIMPSDPNLPPTSQESGLLHQLHLSPQDPGLLHRATSVPPPSMMQLPPGHHLVHHQGLPPQLAPQPVQMDGPPRSVLVEHPAVPPPPIQLTHRLAGPPHTLHLNPSGPPQAPAPQVATLQAHPQPTVYHPQAHMMSQPSSHQEMFEFDTAAGTQQLPPAPPQFQNFEHVPVSQPGEAILGSAGIVSSTQHYPQYSATILSSAGPTSLANQQHPLLSGAPYSVALAPSSQQFQSHITAGVQPGQPLATHIFQQNPQPVPSPMVSQPQYQPQTLSYWGTQT